MKKKKKWKSNNEKQYDSFGQYVTKRRMGVGGKNWGVGVGEQSLSLEDIYY